MVVVKQFGQFNSGVLLWFEQSFFFSSPHTFLAIFSPFLCFSHACVRCVCGFVPSRVHISEATYKFLKDDFETEPGNGAERDGYIARHNINTHLIIPRVRALPINPLIRLVISIELYAYS